MNYLLNKSEKAIQKAAMEFAKGEFDKEAAREFDKKAQFPKEIWRKAADLGFIGTHLPENLSGGGMGRLESVLIAETFSRICSTTGAAVILAGVAVEWLNRYGSEEQKMALIPEILEGRMQSGAAFVRTASGGQNGLVDMQVVESGASWRIDGELDGVINAKQADIIFLLCRNSVNAESPDGINMLMVEADKPGVCILKNHDMLGLRMTGTARLKYDHVVILPKNLIGKQNQGLKQASRIMPEIRLMMAALALGTAQGALDRALTHIKERAQFGQKLALFQVTRQKIADMALRIEQARCLTYQAAAQIDNYKTGPKMATLANLAATRTAVDICYEAIQLLGGYGYTTEYDVERYYRDAKTIQILSGHENDLKDEVAAAVIGKLRN